MIRTSAALLLVLVTGLSRWPTADGPADVVIRGITVVDVRRGLALPARDLVVRGTLIASVAPAGQPLPAAKTTIEGQGKFAVPGLIDPHVRLTDHSRGSAATLLTQGITAVRDVGTDAARIAEWRRALAFGKMYAPRIARACPEVLGTMPSPAFEPGCGAAGDDTSPVLAALLRRRSGRGAEPTTRVSLHDDLEALARDGARPAAVLRAVTVDAARLLDLPTLGTLDAGMAADLLVTTANPLTAIANLRALDAVVFRGEALTRAHLNLLQSGAITPARGGVESVRPPVRPN